MSPIHRLLTLITRLAGALEARRGVVQALAGVLALGLGFWGWHIHKPPTDFAGWFNNIFRTIQLITLQFPTNLESGVPWQLQLARLLVPAVAAIATLNVLVGAMTRPLRLAGLTRAKGHIVVFGAEQIAGDALKTLAARGQKLVAVMANVDIGRRETLEGLGMTVIDADPREVGTLASLGLAGAAAAFLAGRNDLDNLNHASLVIDHARQRGENAPPLTLGILLEDDTLATELDAALDGLTRESRVRYHRLCPDRDGLRLDLRNYAPALRKTDSTEASRVLILGLVGRWQQVLMQLILSCQDHPTERPCFFLILNAQELAEFSAWKNAKPELDLIATFDVLPCTDGGCSSLGNARLAAPPHLAVVLQTDDQALPIALALRRPDAPLQTQATPILVLQQQEDHLLSRLARMPLKDRNLGDMVAFGGLIRAEAIERVLDRKGDEMAIALHAHYLDASASLPPGSPVALAAWDELPENLRGANRVAVEHLPVLLAGAGLPQRTRSVSDDELECMAKIEHRRWMADRIDRGWHFGAERDNAARLHPSIIPYDVLPEPEKEKDRNSVRALLLVARQY